MWFPEASFLPWIVGYQEDCCTDEKILWIEETKQ